MFLQPVLWFFKHLPRLTWCAVIAVILLLSIGFIAPIKLPVVLYKLSLVVLGVVVGYWLDRTLFPYARPHQHFDAISDPNKDQNLFWFCILAATSGIRRALIVIACVLGLTLGL